MTDSKLFKKQFFYNHYNSYQPDRGIIEIYEKEDGSAATYLDFLTFLAAQEKIHGRITYFLGDTKVRSFSYNTRNILPKTNTIVLDELLATEVDWIEFENLFDVFNFKVELYDGGTTNV